MLGALFLAAQLKLVKSSGSGGLALGPAGWGAAALLAFGVITHRRWAMLAGGAALGASGLLVLNAGVSKT